MDESDIISKQTWNRNISAVNKIGFMDGASEGQKAVFQSSFDLGYQQGFDFGFQLGIKKAMSLQQPSANHERSMRDPRKINCQVCANILTLQQNVGNMHNIQQEKNLEILNQYIL